MVNALLRLVHSTLWRRLPAPFRRKVLFGVAGALAPKPDSVMPPHAGPIIVVGALETTSGLGESARLCHDALAAAGFDVYGIDLTDELLQRRDFGPFAHRDGRALSGPATLVVHVNAPLMSLALMRLGKLVVRGRRIVGYWAWELPRAPASWRPGIRFVHEIWAPTRFVAEAVAPIASGKRISIVPHPVAVRPRSQSHPRDQAPFRVLTLFNMASGFSRKNPLASIAAFKTAFGPDPEAQLTVKCSNADLWPAGRDALRTAIAGAPNITLLESLLSEAELDALYRDSDVVITLHRSEGFGLIVAEAMLLAKPVIATDWSGSTDFLTADCGLPIGYRLVEAFDEQDVYAYRDMQWAEADTAAAAEALTRLRAEPALRHELGRRGAAAAGRAFGVDRYRETIARLLSDNAGSP